MNAASACVECLRRSWLLAMLAPYIDSIACGAYPEKLLALSNEDLVRASAPKVAEQLLARVAALPEERFREQLDENDCWAFCRHRDRYPASLRDVDDAPWALIGRGEPHLLANLTARETVAIIGARRATTYGREVARELASQLGAAGILVISGLGFGIDSCAHRGALEGGRTIAVLGCGPDIAYPAPNRSLWRRITERGLVLSELPPGASPWRWTFPARDRIIAGLCGMAVLVEAPDRSPSVATADLASDLGRDLGAVPGPVNSPASVAPNALIASGACTVRHSQDVLDALAGEPQERAASQAPER